MVRWGNAIRATPNCMCGAVQPVCCIKLLSKCCSNICYSFWCNFFSSVSRFRSSSLLGIILLLAAKRFIIHEAFQKCHHFPSMWTNFQTELCQFQFEHLELRPINENLFVWLRRALQRMGFARIFFSPQRRHRLQLIWAESTMILWIGFFFFSQIENVWNAIKIVNLFATKEP